MIAQILVVAVAASAPAQITAQQVRAFVERQARAWNAGDLAGYFATFTPQARFTDQALGNDNRIVPYGVSTLDQARAQAGRVFASSRVRETSVITAITIAPDGRRAQVADDEVSEITKGGKLRRVCGHSVANLVLTPAGLRSTGQTDTIVRCRARPIR
ncbi:hypothetical protein [Phenylobacterium sp.]|uniref:hypothetical protein n=1 Tax=Phenylobacterium sp. TaxID=1871053 RepID=UPI00286C7873|nr:hypothetical protein [Phenylobacterium sp.]